MYLARKPWKTLALVLKPRAAKCREKARPVQIRQGNEGGALIRQRTFHRKDGSSFMGENCEKQFSDGRLQGIVRDISARKAIVDGRQDRALNFSFTCHQ